MTRNRILAICVVAAALIGTVSILDRTRLSKQDVIEHCFGRNGMIVEHYVTGTNRMYNTKLECRISEGEY